MPCAHRKCLQSVVSKTAIWWGMVHSGSLGVKRLAGAACGGWGAVAFVDGDDAVAFSKALGAVLNV